MINPIQITTRDPLAARADGIVEVVSPIKGERQFIRYEAWCAREVARLAAKGIEAVVKYREHDGKRVCSVWRDGRGCYKYAKNEESENEQA